DECLSGRGVYRIAKKLASDGVPAIGRTGRWTPGYVGRLLSLPAVHGLYQPLKMVTVRVQKGESVKVIQRREPSGEPLPDYYPPVIPLALLHAAQEQLRSRCGARSATADPDGEPNLFTGLARDAITGDCFQFMSTFNNDRKRYCYLVPARQGGVKD